MVQYMKLHSRDSRDEQGTTHWQAREFVRVAPQTNFLTQPCCADNVQCNSSDQESAIIPSQICIKLSFLVLSLSFIGTSRATPTCLTPPLLPIPFPNYTKATQRHPDPEPSSPYPHNKPHAQCQRKRNNAPAHIMLPF